MIEEIRLLLVAFLIELTLHIIPKKSEEGQRLIKSIRTWSKKELSILKGKT